MNPLIWILVVFLSLIGYCVWRMRAQGFTRATAKRWLLYLPIGLVVVVVAVGGQLYAWHLGFEDKAILKWLEILCTGVLVFGIAVKEYWFLRKRWEFWAVLGMLIVSHFTFLHRLEWEKDSYLWLMLVVGMPELIVVFGVLNLLFGTYEPPSPGDAEQ